MVEDPSTTDRPLKEQVKQQTHQVVEQGQQMAGHLAERTGQQIIAQLSNQKERCATTLMGIANALMQTSNHMRDQGQEPISQYGDQVAERLSQLSGYLRQKDVGEFIEETKSFARSQPGLFLGGAIFLGLLAGRFLKSSGRSMGPAASSDDMAMRAAAS